MANDPTHESPSHESPSQATVYHYSGCSTCKRALKWLRSRGVEVTAIDLVAEPPSAPELSRLWVRSGLPLRRFFNVSGQSYRNGGFKDRLPAMSEAEQLKALAADGKLVKRPIVDTGDVVLVGFREADWSERLGL